MKVLYATLFVVITDQITKLLVKGISIPLFNLRLEGMKYAQSINVIGDFFKLTYVENPGMAFGFDPGPESKFFLSLFSIIASVGILIYLYKMRNDGLLTKLALALILGGAIGNLIDRVFYGVIFGYAPLMYGKVVDFFNVEFFNFTLFGHVYERWPIFNVADAAVTVGVVLLIFFSHKKKVPVDNSELEDFEELPMIDPVIPGTPQGEINIPVDGKENNEPADNRENL